MKVDVIALFMVDDESYLFRSISVRKNVLQIVEHFVEPIYLDGILKASEK